MASTVTTLAIFKSLMLRSVDLDPNLDTATKAAMRTRIQNLPSEQSIVLDQSKVLSAQGNASENTSTRAIDIGTSTPTSRVEFDPMTFFVPIRVDGTKGIRGFMPGPAGSSAAAIVESADITVQFRTSPGDPWATFDRNVILPEVTWIQFAVNVATQSVVGVLPSINIYAEQV